MITPALNTHERHILIMEKLNRSGSVKVTQLSQELGTSVVTIRSDLGQLEKNGLLQRVRGGAVPPTSVSSSTDYLYRIQLNRASKIALSIAAAELVHDGDTLFINAGSTTHYFAQQLTRHKNISIVTNSWHVAEELGKIPTFRVILLGGNINAQFSFTHGDYTINQLRLYRADYAFLSVDGIGADGRITTYHSDEVAICQSMMERSNATIVIADHSKIGKEGFTYISNAQKMHTLVTDDQSDYRVIECLQNAGVNVIIAASPDT